jgi:hypothetical protein
MCLTFVITHSDLADGQRPQTADMYGQKREGEKKGEAGDASSKPENNRAGDEPIDYWLSDLCGQLSAVVASKPAERLTTQIGQSLTEIVEDER